MKECDSDSDSTPAGRQPPTQDDYAIGYGRPPVHSRFKPGKSGNPKGRRRGARNLKTLRRELYLDQIRVRDGDKTRKIPRVLAIDAILLNRALKGDVKSAQLASKIASELAVYDETFPVNTGYPMDLTKEQIELLSDEDLSTMIRIMKKAHQISDDS